MHAYLLIGNNKDTLSKKVEELGRSIGGILVPEEGRSIADIRLLIKKAAFSYPKPTIFYIANIDQGTPEAMNAFLKCLEEPGHNVHFILSAQNEQQVLPTILSRTLVCRLQSQNEDMDDKNFLESSISDRFAIIESLTKREDAFYFLENCIQHWHTRLIQGRGENTIKKALIQAQETLTRINANGNVGIQLIRLAIKLPIM